MNTNYFTLPVSDPRAQAALRTGWLDQDSKTSRQWVIAKRVVDSPSGASVIFEPKEDSLRPAGLALWAATTRAYSLTATLTPCLAVFAYSFYQGVDIQWSLAIAATLGVLALQVAINVFNDVEDYRRLIDLPGTLGGSGAIQEGWWTPSALRKIAWTALIVGALLGLPAVVSHSANLWLIGALGGIGVLQYSARRVGLKYLAAGDLTVWLLCGPLLTAGAVVSATGQSSPAVLWIGSFFGWLAVAILHVNNLQDIPVDTKRGVKTLARLLGFNRSLGFLGLSYVFATGSLVGAAIASQAIAPFALPFLVVAALATPWMLRLKHALGPESALLVGCRVKAAQIHLLSGLALTVSLLIFGALR